MNIEKVYFEGKYNEILELSKDLENFKQGNLENMINVKMINFEKGSLVLIYPLTGEEISSLENENIFENFKADLKNQTVIFNYNNKKYFVYATSEIYKKRFNLDLEEYLK